MKTVFLAIVFAALLPAAASADDFASLEDARKMADSAVAFFAEEKFAEGYSLLKPYWPLAAVEIDNLANQTNTQWPVVRQRFGTTVSTEFVEQLAGGSSFSRLIYLQKFQNHAIRWVFTFYKPKDRWVINAVSFDDQIDQLFH